MAIRSGQQASASRGLVRASRFDLAVSDKSVWDYIHMLRIVLRVPDQLLSWLQGCPCHSSCTHQRDEPSCDPSGPKQSCVMKARRAPELAAGFMTDFIKDQLEGAVCTFPSQSVLYTDYVAGLQRINFMLQIKFAFWTRLPHALLAIARPDETTAQNSARRILGQWETLTPAERLAAHSVTKEFLEDTGVGGIRSLLVGFVQGRFSRTSQEFRPVRARLACWAFAPMLEGSIEGRRARSKPLRGIRFECPVIADLNGCS